MLFSIAAFFASILPVVGAALVWVPAGLYLIFTGALWKGIFILAWGAIVISMVDNVVRPWVVSGKVELHPLVLMFVILGGVQVFGFLGLFLRPGYRLGAGGRLQNAARRAGEPAVLTSRRRMRRKRHRAAEAGC